MAPVTSNFCAQPIEPEDGALPILTVSEQLPITAKIPPTVLMATRQRRKMKRCVLINKSTFLQTFQVSDNTFKSTHMLDARLMMGC